MFNNFNIVIVSHFIHGARTTSKGKSISHVLCIVVRCAVLIHNMCYYEIELPISTKLLCSIKGGKKLSIIFFNPDRSGHDVSDSTYGW